MADDSGDVILDTDWLPRAEGARFRLVAESRGLLSRRVGNVLRSGAQSRKPTQCNKIGNACIKTWSREPGHCIKIGNACIKIGDTCIKVSKSIRKCISIDYSSSQCIKI